MISMDYGLGSGAFMRSLSVMWVMALVCPREFFRWGQTKVAFICLRYQKQLRAGHVGHWDTKVRTVL